jgi:phosphate-selective porin OprO/OprP
VSPFFKYTAIAAVLMAASIQTASADTASSKGGITIKSDDGLFDATLGGRIHFDGAALKSGDNVAAGNENSGFYFRRVFISLAGHAYGWGYHIDEDISGTGSPGAGFNDVWLSKSFGDSTVYIGQHKPWRSMDEEASNNDTVFMERNVLSANGLFGGRDFTQGLYYKYTSNGLWLGASGYSQTKAGKGNTQGLGGNARIAYAPINEAGKLLHVGVTYSIDQFDLGGGKPGFGTPTAGYSTSYSKSGNSFNVLTFGAASTAKANTATLETMGIIGPVFLQGEYGTAKYKDDGAAPIASQTVNAYSVTASWFVTGESRTYKTGDAAYGGAKINSAHGAVELGVRYDNIKNKDSGAKVSAVTLGANYYFNQNVRFMLDYSLAKVSDFAAGTGGLVAGATSASPKALSARAQISF